MSKDVRKFAGRSSREIVQEVTNDALPYLDLRNIPASSRSGLRVSKTSNYGDDSWSFHAEVGAHAITNTRIDFWRICFPDGSKLTDPSNQFLCECLKEFAYTLVTDPPPSRPKLTTTIRYVNSGPIYLLRFMHTNHIRSFRELEEGDFERFKRWLIATPNKNKPSRKIAPSCLLTRVRGISWLYDQRHKMEHALRFNPWIDQSPEEWAESVTGERKGLNRTPEMPDDVARQVIAAAIKEIQGYRRYFAAEEAYKAFRDSGQRLGFDWTAHGFQSHFEWSSFPSYVTAAGYALIALFSGMRAHEVTGMRLWYEDNQSGTRLPCKFSEDVVVNGEVRRCHFVRSYTTKLEKEPRLATWQVAPVVFDAIDAVIAIRARYRKNSTLIFVPRMQESKADRYRPQSMNIALAAFVQRHDIRWNGQLWHLTTHQFRKKFARFLVRQGLGLRDIQDQLKHIDIEMTKRYGDLYLHAELQQEQLALSKEHYEELLRGSMPIIGGGAAEVEQLRAEFIGKTREDQDKMLDDLSKAALIDAVDFGFCMYNPRRSKCGGTAQNCKPADCLNSVIPLDTALRHLQGRKVRNDQLLRVVKSPLARAHILEVQESTTRLLDQAARKGAQTTEELKALA